MKKTVLIIGAAAIAIAIPAIAVVADGPGQRMTMMKPDMTRAQVEAMVKEKFAKADTNKDGAVTMAEVDAARTARHAERMDARFKAMDANNDGSISRAEFDAAHERMAERGAGGPAMGMNHDGPGGMQGGMGHRHGHDMGPGGPGMGGPGMGMKFGTRMFERADANKDGKVTLAEATRAALTHFDEVDTDKNGTVTAQERMNFWKNKRADWMKDAKPGS